MVHSAEFTSLRGLGTAAIADLVPVKTMGGLGCCCIFGSKIGELICDVFCIHSINVDIVNVGRLVSLFWFLLRLLFGLLLRISLGYQGDGQALLRRILQVQRTENNAAVNGFQRTLAVVVRNTANGTSLSLVILKRRLLN
jgi:hypothetical protein